MFRREKPELVLDATPSLRFGGDGKYPERLRRDRMPLYPGPSGRESGRQKAVYVKNAREAAELPEADRRERASHHREQRAFCFPLPFRIIRKDCMQEYFLCLP